MENQKRTPKTHTSENPAEGSEPSGWSILKFRTLQPRSNYRRHPGRRKSKPIK
jgi:hypothetical protein